ncbi:MAG: AmmeMemoRadiSam system protein B [Candidatus Hydrogenedentota bacterium]
MIRQPAVAGSFYEGNRERLIDSIKKSFSSKFGPGSLKETKDMIIAAVSPHAGYFYSGAAASFVYSNLAKRDWQGTIVLLGFSHQGLGTGVSQTDWKTPLGIIETDKDWLSRINKLLPVDDRVHSYEHSIEVQLPFIQFIACEFNQKIKVLCISVGRETKSENIANALLQTEKVEAVYIASSDFTHYGHRFGYAPYARNAKEKMKEVDLKIADTIITLDITKFDELLDSTEATVCGTSPIRALMYLLKLKNAKTGKILKYYTSGDVIGDYEDMVGYCSIVWER